MTDLSLVLREDLYKELCSRFDGVVLITLKKMDSHNDETMLDYHGGRALCIGLCEHMKDKLLSVMRDEVEHEEKDNG